MTSVCICPEWEPNIKKVDAPTLFLHARNPRTYKGYDGEPFRYCPWCGRWLCLDEKDAERARRTATP